MTTPGIEDGGRASGPDAQVTRSAVLAAPLAAVHKNERAQDHEAVSSVVFCKYPRVRAKEATPRHRRMRRISAPVYLSTRTYPSTPQK